MRVVIVGAVDSTRVAIEAVAAAPGWSIAAVVTLPLDLAGRHSDFVDLRGLAAAAGANVIETVDSNAPEVCAAIAALAPDFVLVIGWSQICRPPFMAAAGGRVIGYHPAPLPRLRGRGVLPWTILLAEPITAGTLFWIDEGVDTGPILAQHFLHVGAEEDVTSLYARHLDVLAALIAEALPALASGRPPRRAQDERFATWAARRTPADGAIDWHRPARDIARQVRAVSRPYPGAFTDARGEQLVVWTAAVGPGFAHAAATPGQVVDRAVGFSVRCGCGDLLHVTDWDSPSGRLPAMHSRLGRA
jgi:methionyl-tRNA formyltransferase